MKSNIFKYIFIIFVIVIIVYSIYAIYFKDKQKTEDMSDQIETTTETEEKKDLRLGISNFDNMNPLISNNKEILNIDKLIFEPLLSLSYDYKLENCLATECSKVSDTSYIVKVDTSKKWQDGSFLTAKDVQFTIDRLKEGQSIYAYNVEKVSSVEIIDSSTIKINLFEPVEFFEYNLVFPILPNNYYIGENFYESEKTPMGTGMYKIVSMDESNIILGKNDRWWNADNTDYKIEAINIKKFSEMGEVYNSFKLGNIDILTTSNNNLENYIGTIGYTKHECKGREFDYLAFNCQQDILKNVEVRKAIAQAIDKNNIISSVYNNNYFTSNFPIDYGNYLYSEENNNVISYNQDEAKKTLIENGWEYKYSRWQKVDNYKTKRINLNLTVNKDDAERLATAEMIKTQLEQIGIKITLRKVSKAQYDSILENKNYEMILTGVYNSYSPNLNTFFAENNLENYSNEELNSILSEVKNTTDEKTLKEKYNRIIQIYNEEVPFVSLYRNKIMVVKSQKLFGDVVPNNYCSYYNLFSWTRI